MAHSTHNSNEHGARRATIRSLIRSTVVGTQEDLRRRLKKNGFQVTQATLSRDLARLGARRVALPSGGTVYEVDEMRVREGIEALASVAPMVTSVVDTSTMVVIQTLTGAASAVALAIDRARLKESAGTIAGDDTIFVAPAKGVPPSRVARNLLSLWMKGAPQ